VEPEKPELVEADELKDASVLFKDKNAAEAAGATLFEVLAVNIPEITDNSTAAEINFATYKKNLAGTLRSCKNNSARLYRLTYTKADTELELNFSNLLDKFNKQQPDNNIVNTYEGKGYINGAIAFYGGGKNYSWVDTSGVSENFNELEMFEVPLDYFGSRSELIYYAAGKENFRFMVYDNDSKLSYQKQQNDLTDGTAYSWIVRK
jgi:hypothetical protein